MDVDIDIVNVIAEKRNAVSNHKNIKLKIKIECTYPIIAILDLFTPE